MSFGFDPSIILGAQQYTGPDPDQSMRLADMLHKRGREQTLAGIYRRSADHPETLSSELMRGGFGQEAFEAQNQSSQMAAQRAQLGKAIQDYQRQEEKRIGESFYGVKDQKAWDAARGGVPEQFRHMIPEKFDSAVAERLGNLSIPAEKRAELADKPRFHLSSNPVTGSTTKIDQVTGAITPVEAGGAPGLGSGPLKPKDVEDQFKELTTAVSTVKGRANLNAQNQARLYNSERVKQIALDENGKVKNLSPAMITDLAAATAALSSNGSPAQSVIEHFLPKGHGMKAASIAEWLTNNPHGADQQGFIEQMVGLANREEKLITHQMRAGQVQAVPDYAHLKRLNPTRFTSILRGAGLDPSAIDENGLPITVAPGALSPQDAAAIDWAKKNPADDRAAQILKMHGGG